MKITDEYGNRYTIDQPLNAGGQGAVFRIDENPKLLLKAIVKTDNQIVKDEHRYRGFEESVLRVMALCDIPNVAKPLGLLEKPNCGYIMRLMENMQDVEKIMMPKKMGLAEHYIDTGGLYKRLHVLKNVAKTLSELYKNGIVYCDISPKNIFISANPEDHEAWLIDVDNMNYETDSELCIGTPSYMSPEVYLGNKNTMKSDVYSFALLAYELLTYSKPFEGQAMNTSDQDDWGDDWGVDYAEESLGFDEKVARGLMPWVLQKNDDSNRRIDGMGIPPEAVMTSKMLELFEQTFGAGRPVPSKRPTMTQWYHALSDACNAIVKCPNGHCHLGNTCFLCNEKSEYYTATSCYLSEEVDGENDEIWREIEISDRSQAFQYQSGKAIDISNGLIMGYDFQYTYPILSIRVRKSGDGKVGLELISRSDDYEFKLVDSTVDSIDEAVIEVKKKKDKKTFKRIKFKREVAK